MRDQALEYRQIVQDMAKELVKTKPKIDQGFGKKFVIRFL